MKETNGNSQWGHTIPYEFLSNVVTLAFPLRIIVPTRSNGGQFEPQNKLLYVPVLISA